MAAGEKKTCFVIGPIGEEGSDVRNDADWLLDEIIGPVFEQHSDFKVLRADRMSKPGLIDSQVINLLHTAELVIADLTTLNPNVFYEIGIRHMVPKPIIHMLQAGSKPPFDVSLQRTIPYGRARSADLRKARIDLAAQVEEVLAPGFQVENPVTAARGRAELEQHATPEQRVLMEEVDSLKQRISRLELSRGASASDGEGIIVIVDLNQLPNTGDMLRLLDDVQKLIATHHIDAPEGVTFTGDGIALRFKRAPARLALEKLLRALSNLEEVGRVRVSPH
jgi:hypothetical protein